MKKKSPPVLRGRELRNNPAGCPGKGPEIETVTNLKIPLQAYTTGDE
jgi:hypothetical protein